MSIYVASDVGYHFEVAVKAWRCLVEEIERQWSGDDSPSNYNVLRVERLEIENVPNSDGISTCEWFNKGIRQNESDTLVVIYEKDGHSYALNTCAFIFATKNGGKRRAEDELVWEIAHEICHAFGAGHSYEGIMSRPYSPEEEFSLDSQAAATLQHCAYISPEEEARSEFHIDYVDRYNRESLSTDLNRITFFSARSGPRFIYMLDQQDKYHDIYSYDEELAGHEYALEVPLTIAQRIVVIFFDRRREFINLKKR